LGSTGIETKIMTIVSTKKYVFIGVFKTGSSTVRKQLLKCDPDATVVRRRMHDRRITVRGSRQTSHVKSSWIKENIFPKMDWDWDEYFKFGFVRNPWDRELSNYFYNSKKLKPPEDISFKEWLNINLRKDGLIENHNIPQCDYLTDVDYIARFENFEEEVKYIFNRIGVPLSQKIFHYNKTEHKPYWKYYDDADIMKVHQWYEKDIEMYNYEFGE
jgi:hypothetical protein